MSDISWIKPGAVWKWKSSNMYQCHYKIIDTNLSGFDCVVIKTDPDDNLGDRPLGYRIPIYYRQLEEISPIINYADNYRKAKMSLTRSRT